MDIRKVDSGKTIKEKIKSLKKSKTSESSGKSIQQSQFFDKLLEVTNVKEINLELDKIIDRIDTVGKRFAKNPDIENLSEYKSLIKAFLDTVMNKIFKIKEKMGNRSWVKHKVYITVEKIDKKLEELTNFILNKETENINLLATLDEIRGMLVDLYK